MLQLNNIFLLYYLDLIIIYLKIGYYSDIYFTLNKILNFILYLLIIYKYHK